MARDIGRAREFADSGRGEGWHDGQNVRAGSEILEAKAGAVELATLPVMTRP